MASIWAVLLGLAAWAGAGLAMGTSASKRRSPGFSAVRALPRGYRVFHYVKHRSRPRYEARFPAVKRGARLCRLLLEDLQHVAVGIVRGHHAAMLAHVADRGRRRPYPFQQRPHLIEIVDLEHDDAPMRALRRFLRRAEGEGRTTAVELRPSIAVAKFEGHAEQLAVKGDGVIHLRRDLVEIGRA